MNKLLTENQRRQLREECRKVMALCRKIMQAKTKAEVETLLDQLEELV